MEIALPISVDLLSIVVYSEYLTKFVPSTKIYPKWNFLPFDIIDSPNTEIGEITIETPEGECKTIEKKIIRNPFPGKILNIPEIFEIPSNKSPILLFRMSICNHDFSENSSNCPFCEEKPTKLAPSLEKLYFMDPKPHFPILNLQKIIGVPNRIYSKNDEIILLKTEENILKITTPIGGTLSWCADLRQNPIPSNLFSIIPCKHAEIFQDLCTSCSELVLNYHENPDNAHLLIKGVTIVAEEEKKNYAEVEKNVLISNKKLILILDLDNTLIHAIMSRLNENNTSDVDLTDVYEWVYSRFDKFLIKLRPYLKEFFTTVQPLYEIFLYTMGTRGYAEYNRCLLNDIKGAKIEKEKMIALEDNFKLAQKKIKRMLPYSEEMVLILDDRLDVWPEDNDNLIFTKPYWFFREKNQEKIVVRPYDCYLFFAAQTLFRIHRVFFELREKGCVADVRKIYEFFKKKMFMGKKICFSGLVERSSENSFENNRYVGICREGGAIVTEDIENGNPDILIVKEFRTTHKVHVAVKNKIPIVHFNWIDYCLIFSMMITWNSFELSQNKKEIKDIWDMEKDLVEQNKEFIKEQGEEIIKRAVDMFSG